MSSQLPKELELKAKNSGTKGYKSFPINKLLSEVDASEPIKENFEDIKLSFKSKNKNIRSIRRENYEADKILRDLDLTFGPEKDHYESKKTVDAFNDYYIQCESIGDKDKTLTIKEYLDMVSPYLNDIINYHKTQNEWKIHLKIVINFTSSEYSNKNSYYP